MLVFSIIGMVMGPIVELMHLTDWWMPHFLFNSFIKIEDLLFGFSIAGVISSVYNILKFSKKKYFDNYQYTPSNKKVSILSPIVILFGSFYVVHISSFLSSILTFCFGIFFIMKEKPKLLPSILLTGFFILILALPGYLFGLYINPLWIQQEWILSKLSGITIYAIPIEELIWFLFAGMGIAAFQEIYLNPVELINTNNINPVD